MSRVIAVRSGPGKSVIKAGIRGRPGPTIANAEFDTDGRLVITLEDGTQLMTEPLNRPFESIIGDPMDNAALAELFNAKVDGEDFGTFVTAVNNALGERYTKSQADALLLEKVGTDDERLSDSRPPTGGAGGVLSGTYPNPGFAVGMATQSDLDTALLLKLNTVLKGAPLGLAELDSNGKVPLAQINDAVLGQVEYQGTWDAATNTPTVPATPVKKGDYYVTSGAGNRFGLSFEVGDWIISDGTKWDKIDNTDAVQSVQGRTGAVVITAEDIGVQVGATANATNAQLRDRATHTGSQAATTVTIADAGNYFAGTNAETVLQEVGALIGNTAAALDAINGEVI